MIFEARAAYRTLRKEGFLPLVKKLRVYLRDLTGGMRFMASRIPEHRTLEELLGFAANTAGGLIKASQVESEITQLLALLEARRPKVVVEIGTANGGTLFLFCRTVHPEAVVTSIDLPNGIHGGGYPYWKSYLYRRFIRPTQTMHLIRADSRAPETLAKLKAILGERRIDFLLIDGDHTYEGVKADFQNYLPLVAKGGLVAFHDICVHEASWNCQVDVFWREIRSQYRHVEFIENPAQGWGGIGVLFIE